MNEPLDADFKRYLENFIENHADDTPLKEVVAIKHSLSVLHKDTTVVEDKPYLLSKIQALDKLLDEIFSNCEEIDQLLEDEEIGFVAAFKSILAGLNGKWKKL